MNSESRGLVQRIQNSLMSGMKKSDTLPAAKKAPEHAPVKQSSGSASPRPMKRRAESAAPPVAFTSSTPSTPSTLSTSSAPSTAPTSPTQSRASTASVFNSAPSPIVIQSEKDTRTSEVSSAVRHSVEKALDSYTQRNTSGPESPSQTQPSASNSTEEEEDDELTTSIITGLEEEYKKTEELSASQSTSEWKSKYEELLKNFEELKSQFSLVQQENELLKIENENLGKVVDSLKKRLALNAK